MKLSREVVNFTGNRKVENRQDLRMYRLVERKIFISLETMFNGRQKYTCANANDSEPCRLKFLTTGYNSHANHQIIPTLLHGPAQASTFMN